LAKPQRFEPDGDVHGLLGSLHPLHEGGLSAARKAWS
jgi:hypothetical protein